MNKLICSFKSDLPNEIDFAIQVSTLLANTDNFIWSKDYPLVDAICSSLHVFVCVCKDSLNCYCYTRFWHKLLTKYQNNIYLQAATIPPDKEQSCLNFNSMTDHEFKDHNKIYRRLKIVAEIIKQFSMTTGISTDREEKNVQSLEDFSYPQIKKKKTKASPSLLKFVSLLYHCDDKTFNLIGLDILSNLGSKLSKVPDTTDDLICSKLVQLFQERCIESISRQDGDIYEINRSIEVVTKIISSSSKSVTSNITSLIIDKNITLRIEQLLTSHYDVTLFLSALEFCYRISRHQPHLLTGPRARYLVKILVNLLNCDDDRYFTKNALKKVKILDSRPNSMKSQPISTFTTTTLGPITTKPIPSTPTPLPSRPATQPTIVNPPTPVNIKTTATNINSNSITTNSVASNSAPQPITIITNNTVSSATLDPPSTKPTQSSTTPTPSLTVPTSTSTVPAQTSSNHTSTNQTSISIAPSSTTPVLLTATTAQPTLMLNSAPQIATTNSTGSQPAPKPKYACRWNNCGAQFFEAKQVYVHVFGEHISPIPPDTLSSCLWSGPQGSGPGCSTKRPKFSLLTHVNDFHCNQGALDRPQPVQPPLHPGYAPNAAVLAIRRHANNQKVSFQHQSTLSTSVRLTAAIILRNLATESSDIKQALESHEYLLSEICMSNGDEAKIVAECLSLFSNN